MSFNHFTPISEFSFSITAFQHNIRLTHLFWEINQTAQLETNQTQLYKT